MLVHLAGNTAIEDYFKEMQNYIMGQKGTKIC